MLVTVSGLVIVATYSGAFFVSRKTEWSGRRRQVTGDAIGVVFAIAILAFVEALLQRTAGISFYTLLHGSTGVVVAVFVGGALLGMSYEYVWQFGLQWWHYPSVEKRKILLILLPVFWGIFMLIMQDTYAILRVQGLGIASAATLTAIIQGILIEGINIWTRSWVYTGPGASLRFLIPGWVVLLGFVFVPWFNTLFVNPFGY